ncbi:MAG: DUF3267 domain-containing protein [Bacillota bacterium]
MVPGILIALLTFPGVIVHEIGHEFFCRLTGVLVYDVKYFRVGNPSGYVIHSRPKNFSQQFWITAGPFIVNSVVAVVVALPAALPYFVLGAPMSILHWFLLWVGVSVGMHAFPSSGDAQSLLSSIKLYRAQAGPLIVLAYPFAWAIFIANVLRFFWIDFFYTAFLVSLVPKGLVALIK